jgi:hypothetical protein
MFLKAEQFRWIRGESQVVSYKLPEAPRFTVAFCRNCGGAAPQLSGERGFALTPAGTLDTDPGIRPMGHIYTGSKASWFDIAGDAPQFTELPPTVPI